MNKNTVVVLQGTEFSDLELLRSPVKKIYYQLFVP